MSAIFLVRTLCVHGVHREQTDTMMMDGTVGLTFWNRYWSSMKCYLYQLDMKRGGTSSLGKVFLWWEWFNKILFVFCYIDGWISMFTMCNCLKGELNCLFSLCPIPPHKHPMVCLLLWFLLQYMGATLWILAKSGWPPPKNIKSGCLNLMVFHAIPVRIRKWDACTK